MAECFRCHRFLGEKEEWKKMDTEKGLLCYVCYNEISAKQRITENHSEQEQDQKGGNER